MVGRRTARSDNLLRELPACARWFWKETTNEQLNLTVSDNALSCVRKLSANELLSMALNEIAVHEGRGWFMHLPDAASLKQQPSNDLFPDSRKPPQPGPRYASLLYMDFVWTEVGRRSFYATPQRGRYLRCDARLNPPISSTPLLAIHVMYHTRHSLKYCPDEVLHLIQTDDIFYLCSSSELRESIGGSRSFENRSIPETQGNRKLKNPVYLWKKNNSPTQGLNEDQLRSFQAMQRYRKETLKDVYDSIWQRCRSGSVSYTFTAGELASSILPRPTAPERGIPLGVPVVLDTSEHESEESDTFPED